MIMMINIHFRYVHPTPSQNSETSFLISGSIVLKPVTYLLIMPKRSKQVEQPAVERPQAVKRRHTSKSPPDRDVEAAKKSDKPNKIKPFCLNKKFQKQKDKKDKKHKRDKESTTPVVEEKPEVKGARSTRPSAIKKPSASTTSLPSEKDKVKLAALKESIKELGALEKNNDSGDDGEDSSDDMDAELQSILQQKGEGNKKGETEEKAGESESEGSDDSEQEDGESCDSDEAESSSEDSASGDDGEGDGEKNTSIVPHEEPDAAPEEPEKPLVRNSTWSLMLSSLLSFPPSLRIRTLKIATN